MPDNIVKETNFYFHRQHSFYRGKVRDVYRVGNYLISVATDRISAFDHILPRCIPFKGQVLNQTAQYFLEATKDIVPNWLLSCPDPNVSIGLICEPIRLEMVIRGYLVGHAWRTYRSGKRELCGVTLPDGMIEYQQFDEPIITPATKAESGHDEDISKDEILKRNIVSASIYEKLESFTRDLYHRGTQMAQEKGLLLIDTKYEFGIYDGKIYLIDEIHTPDSSRYFYAQDYSVKLATGQSPDQLSKEFVREWLMAHDFQGLQGQVMPEMSDHFVDTVSRRYIELYETLTGQKFVAHSHAQPVNRIFDQIIEYLDS